MVFFNWATMQMAAKIVYYGPGLCGKTTNLSFIYAKTSPGSRGEMVSLETETDRTLFFDLLPIEVGTIGGFKTRLQLYTVPGQVFYNTTRKLVLKGVDGVVFVADSQRPMREANLESLENLRVNLAELDLDLDDMPIVVQLNKRDLKNIMTVEEMAADLNPDGRYALHEASAINGDGVFETLKDITKLTLKKLRRRMAAPSSGPRPARPRLSTPTPAASTPSGSAGISAAALAQAAEEEVAPAERAEPVAAEPAPEPVESPAAAEPEPDEVSPHEITGPQDVPADEAEPAAEAADEPAPAEELEEVEDVEELELDDAHDEEAEELDSSAEHEEVEEIEAAEIAAEPIDDEPAAEAAPSAPAEDEPEVEFDRSEAEEEEPAEPQLKRVQVSNQLDILAELDTLRKQATMSSSASRSAAKQPDLDLDSLLSGSAANTREMRRKVSENLNSDIFARMRSMQVAVRIQDGDGDTIHTLDPVSISVDDATELRHLLFHLTVDMENRS